MSKLLKIGIYIEYFIYLMIILNIIILNTYKILPYAFILLYLMALLVIVTILLEIKLYFTKNMNGKTKYYGLILLPISTLAIVFLWI